MRLEEMGWTFHIVFDRMHDQNSDSDCFVRMGSAQDNDFPAFVGILKKT